jgi:hypothetical protein
MAAMHHQHAETHLEGPVKPALIIHAHNEEDAIMRGLN